MTEFLGISTVAMALGLVPAFIAQARGRSFGVWWLYGAVLFPIALFHALVVLRPRWQAPVRDGEELDAATARAHTHEGLRKLAEDAGVAGEVTGSGWRPVSLGATDVDELARPPDMSEARPPPSSPVPVDQWIRVGEVFSPAAPVNRKDLFAGRHLQMESLIDVAFERGQHAVVFGERGVGKTSLATIMTIVFASGRTKISVKINCDASDTYDSIWRKVFDEIEFGATTGQEMSRDAVAKVKAAVSGIQTDVPLTPNEVRKILRLLATTKEYVIFIDEFERLRDRGATTLFADTLKMLSDQQVAATVVLVGVADNIQELLAEHRSIERALVQIHMPRMSENEMQEIVRRGLEAVDMKIQDQGLDLITGLSRGLPHFTHLLAQGAARAAIDESQTEITAAHVQNALQMIVDRVQDTITEAYEIAVHSARETLYPKVLLAAAAAATDEQGFFSAADLVVPLSMVTRRPYDIPAFARHLHALAEPGRGPALQKKGYEHRHRFRFYNPLLQPYVLMKGVAEKQIDADFLTRD